MLQFKKIIKKHHQTHNSIQQKNFKTDGEYPHLFNIKKIIANIFLPAIQIQIYTLAAFEIIQQLNKIIAKKMFGKKLPFSMILLHGDHSTGGAKTHETLYCKGFQTKYNKYGGI
ncbi:hypothetical protein U0035_05695 [Niabella yanshanensis]|uniref:Uncharacterized protein n=1 Tax=Niabella yanshanensis TaxID=577386 RepID=A0ABZ0W8N2_9BACT|nr:hypothetical protein [Niabella yanshanensis]WQD39638.1 hypothetical protein U0035_05695 [Niabella yanshanensis]